MTILIASIIGILIIFQTECSKRNEGMPNVNDHMRLKKWLMVTLWKFLHMTDILQYKPNNWNSDYCG